MTALEILQTVQYVTREDGQRFAVLDEETWEALIEWLENQEDGQIIRDSYAELATVNGNREQAGWLRWDGVKDDI